SSRNELFVFAENLRTGKPFPGVKLLVSDGGKVFAEGTTGEDGVFIGSVSEADHTYDPLKTSNDIRVFAIAEVAGAERKDQRPEPKDQTESPASGVVHIQPKGKSAIPPAHIASN